MSKKNIDTNEKTLKTTQDEQMPKEGRQKWQYSLIAVTASLLFSFGGVSAYTLVEGFNEKEPENQETLTQVLDENKSKTTLDNIFDANPEILQNIIEFRILLENYELLNDYQIPNEELANLTDEEKNKLIQIATSKEKVSEKITTLKSEFITTELREKTKAELTYLRLIIEELIKEKDPAIKMLYILTLEEINESLDVTITNIEGGIEFDDSTIKFTGNDTLNIPIEPAEESNLEKYIKELLNYNDEKTVAEIKKRYMKLLNEMKTSAKEREIISKKLVFTKN